MEFIENAVESSRSGRYAIELIVTKLGIFVTIAFNSMCTSTDIYSFSIDDRNMAQWEFS